MNIVFGAAQVGFLLRACEPSRGSSRSRGRSRRRWKKFRRIEREWRAFGGTSLGPADWLRRKAYRAKRKLMRLVVGRTSRKPEPLDDGRASWRRLQGRLNENITDHEQTAPVDSHEHSVFRPLPAAHGTAGPPSRSGRSGHPARPGATKISRANSRASGWKCIP